MPEISKSKYMVQAGWKDVPHLTPEIREELLAEVEPHLRDARERGDPSLSAGAIYPIPISEIVCRPIIIPAHWPRAFGFDVGWNRTAAVWGAKDPLDGIIYLFGEHYMGKQLPIVHATSIKARGAWIKGAIDPAAHGRGQRDGEQLRADYNAAGLNLVDAENAFETGIQRVWELLATGQLRVFETLLSWQAEFRIYRRDENGVVIKKDDHLMDATRYLINTWDKIAGVQQVTTPAPHGGNIDPLAGY